MFCDFISIDDINYRCTRCGISISTSDGLLPFFPCSYVPVLAANDDDPADIDTIEQRFRICEVCEFFKENSCSKCGCIINRTKNYVNKLSSIKSSCPINKW